MSYFFGAWKRDRAQTRALMFDLQIEECVRKQKYILYLQEKIHQSTRNPGHVYVWGSTNISDAHSLASCVSEARKIVADTPDILTVREGAAQTMADIDKTVADVLNDPHPIMERARQEEEKKYADMAQRLENIDSKLGWGRL